jgi:hypothetical protein
VVLDKLGNQTGAIEYYDKAKSIKSLFWQHAI